MGALITNEIQVQDSNKDKTQNVFYISYVGCKVILE